MQRTVVQHEVLMRHLPRCLRLAGAALVAVAATTSGQASSASRSATLTVQRLGGSVLDTTGAPVPLADVRLSATDGWHHALLTDGSGHFVFTLVPVGQAQLEVRRLGFRPITRTLTVSDGDGDGSDSTRIVLAATATELAGIEVNDHPEGGGALAGFYSRRRSNNFGHYLDRADIEKTHAQRPSEALRTVPGVNIQPSRRVGNVIRIRNCRPTIWIDGIRVQDAELDEVTSVDDVAAVEIYKSLAGLPQQFIDRTNPCGAILIWSRSR
jgi:hypothetical protein